MSNDFRAAPLATPGFSQHGTPSFHDELDFGVGQKSQSFANFDRNRDLAFRCDFHLYSRVLLIVVILQRSAQRSIGNVRVEKLWRLRRLAGSPALCPFTLDPSRLDGARHVTRRSSVGKELGRRLAQLRQEAGLTQQAVAAHLGIVQQTLARYEVGRLRLPVVLVPPRDGTILAISSAESIVPLYVSFSCLMLAWLLVSAGMWRSSN